MLTYGGTDVDRLNAVADLLLFLVGNRVRHNDLLKSATVQGFNGRATQNAVGDYSNSVLRSALVDQNTCSLDKSTACIGHVVNKDSGLAGYLSDQGHSGNLIRTSALFVDKRKRQIETVSYGRCSVSLLALHNQKWRRQYPVIQRRPA